MADTQPVLLAAWPQLLVRDLARALDFYSTKIGFETAWSWGDPPTYAVVSRSGVNIHLIASEISGQPNTAIRHGCTDIYIPVTGVDALYEELRGRGAQIVEEIANHEYGMRDFGTMDADGYLIAFGEET